MLFAVEIANMDMIYFPNKTNLSKTSPLGKRLYQHTTRSSVCQTLARRMKWISRYIDNAAENVQNARVLSVASGHCREAEFSHALKNNELGRFVALDHDAASLSVMDHDYKQMGLEAAPLSVSDIIKGRADLGQFDLIYSAGLYDYLGKRFAQKLTAQLYKMLAPGGKLMLININFDYDEIGYLESYMNWAMIGRSKSEILELAAGLNTNEQATLDVLDKTEIDSHYTVLEIIKN